MPPDGNYQVGYKKPPLHSRFKPGRAGNAGGRKKQADGFACLFTEALNETVTITENGRPRTISKRELLVKQVVDQAAKGEPFVIAKAGKPLVKVVPPDAPSAPRRLGFLVGQIAVPEDFDRMGEAEIAALFGTEV